MTSSKNLPVIKIKFARIFQEKISRKLLPDTHAFKSYEESLEKIEQFRQTWKPLEKKILTAMVEILGVNFSDLQIDVFVAPFKGAMSTPLIIGIGQSPDDFVDTLTHELIHIHINNNDSLLGQKDKIENWKKMFSYDHTPTCMAHIPVHSIHKEIFLDVLHQPERLERDIELNKEQNATDYLAAWDYIDQRGYKDINKQLRDYYSGEE